MFPSRAAILRQGLSRMVIGGDVTNQNLKTIATNAGYTGGNCVITINSGVEVWATATNVPALSVGVFPAGVTVTLVNFGFVTGAAGIGGTANYSVGGYAGPGATGGHALDCTMVSGFTFVIDNQGTLRGGAGGGGGGGFSVYGGIGVASPGFGGGGGGGGQGRNNAAGGTGGPGSTWSNGDITVSGTDGSAGSAGSVSGPGAGGPGGDATVYGSGVAGGGGGTYGVAGAAGSNGAGGNGGTSFGGPGGAAGYFVLGSIAAGVVWANFGTRLGSGS